MHRKFKHAHILVVEDNKGDTLLLKRFLHDELISNNVVFCSNIKDALQAIENNEFDIVFADIHLPDGSGLDLAKKVYDITEAAIIMLSGSSDTDTTMEAQENGALAYIQKPLNRQLLNRVMREIKDTYWSIVIDKTMDNAHEC